MDGPRGRSSQPSFGEVRGTLAEVPWAILLRRLVGLHGCRISRVSSFGLDPEDQLAKPHPLCGERLQIDTQ